MAIITDHGAPVRAGVDPTEAEPGQISRTATVAQDFVRRSSQLLPAGSAQNMTVTSPRPPDL